MREGRGEAGDSGVCGTEIRIELGSTDQRQESRKDLRGARPCRQGPWVAPGPDELNGIGCFDVLTGLHVPNSLAA